MAEATRSDPGPLARSYLSGSSGVFVPTFAVKATGDPAAAILFGQLIWWLTKAEHPTTVERAGERWLVKAHDAWQDDTGMTAHQARGAIKRLVEKGLIEVKRWKHRGAPTTHLRVCWAEVENALTAQMDSPDRADGNGQERESQDLRDSANPPLSETEETTDLTPATADAVAWHQRPDVVSLCDHLADRIAENGSKRPKVNTGWLIAAKRMIDIDKRDPEKAHRLIDWCQDDEFEQTVVLSMPKFRSRYDSLRLKANRSVRSGRPKESAAMSKGRRAAEAAAALRSGPKELSA